MADTEMAGRSDSFASASTESLPLFLVQAEDAAKFLGRRSPAEAAWLRAQGFTGKLGQTVVLPGPNGTAAGAAFGLGTPDTRARESFSLARAAEALPEGAWHLEGRLSQAEAEEAALGWLLGRYRFDRYRAAPAPKARLKAPKGVDAARIEVLAASEALTRDLINTPANDMGPDELEAAFRKLGAGFGAKVGVTRGDALLARNLPLIHAVGRASPRAPRLLDLRWGRVGPKVTLVGKGVCFDTGGLDLKPAASMGLMKKDMGGAATVMGLARSIMALKLKVRLRVLVPAVENAVAGNAFRPQDVLTSRKGLTVEINNTDAEGRLILADALALACEEAPDLLVSMATLTGAARVALGPDVPPFFTDDERWATALARAALRVADPLWRMPFWAPYEALIEPGIADLDNAPGGGMAGAITAALFLRRFVEPAVPYVHFDIYGWRPAAAPGRPKGGVGQGARALIEAMPKVLGL